MKSNTEKPIKCTFMLSRETSDRVGIMAINLTTSRKVLHTAAIEYLLALPVEEIEAIIAPYVEAEQSDLVEAA